MKIFNAANSREADETTIQKQNITSAALMARAGAEVYSWLKKSFPDKETVYHIFCGKGNNGGDGLVVARLLHNDGYAVHTGIIGQGNASADFSTMLQLLEENKIEYNKGEPINVSGKGRAVVVDALFGTGLSRDLDDEVKQVVEKINSSKAYIVSVDVPSGMFLEQPTQFAVRADVVLTFQLPKLAFFLPGNQEYVKQVEIMDIGLDAEFIENTHTGYHYTDSRDAYHRYRPVHHFAHKGTQGHALLIGGSYGKIGAVTLSAKAALKAGCGLVTAYVPECGYTVLQTAFPEAMVITNGEKFITEISFGLQPKAIGIGPGMGQDEATQKALGDFLKLNKVPLVIDADALNMLSYNKEWLDSLTQDTILTPHPKELERLIGAWSDDFDKMAKMKAFAARHEVVLVAKDAHTMVVYKDTVHINSSGNAAMATGGSGDVLTGIITGLLAQGYNAVDAAIFGVYLHGLTADIAVADTGHQAFTASTILEYLGKAFLRVEAECR